MMNQRWKADEMEMTINFKSLRIAYIFTEFCLALYCVYKFVVSGEIPEVSVIWFSGGVLFFLSKLIYTNKMTRINDNEE